MCSARAASPARLSGAPGRPALAPWSAWHPSGPRVSRGSSCCALQRRGNSRRCSSAASLPARSRSGRGGLCAQTYQHPYVTCWWRLLEAQQPLGRRRTTYEEKTCCLTSEEGFEFSAPMLLQSEVRDASAMMQLLGEVGAQPWPSAAGATTHAARIAAECWMHQKVDAMSSTRQRHLSLPPGGVAGHCILYTSYFISSSFSSTNSVFISVCYHKSSELPRRTRPHHHAAVLLVRMAEEASS